MSIDTIGHSTRSFDEFVELLHAHNIGRVADIRTVPRSRRHPHFSAEALSRSLPAIGIEYRHFPGLGGLRKPRRDSRNSAWRHEGFRGYADYMETAEFRDALTDLIEWSDAGPERPGLRARRNAGPERLGLRARRNAGPERLGLRTEHESRADLLGPPHDRLGPQHSRVVIMCAEAVWWRCHRQLTADALLANGVEVCHITGSGPASAHKLTEFARVVDRQVRYPGLV